MVCLAAMPSKSSLNAAVELLDAFSLERGDDVVVVEEIQHADDDIRINPRRCPFLNTAKVFPAVVCALHVGLMQRALAELGAPLEADRLDPLVEPTLCVAHVRRAL